MKKLINLISICVIAFVIIFWLSVEFTTIYIPAGYVGVRTREYSLFSSKGVVKEDFQSGWHMKLSFLDSWVLFDSTVQTLEMTRDPLLGDRRGRDDIQVQSADGYTVSVDVTMKYRIKKGFAHKLYQDTGQGDKYKTIVRNESQKACIDILGKMKTEDFYNPEQIRQKRAELEKRLSSSLEDNFVEVIAVLIRNVEFDPEYENKIRKKKLADQEVELNISLGGAAIMKGKTQVIVAETNKKIKIINQELKSKLITMKAQANKEIAEILAKANRYATEKESDANLILSQKTAEGSLLEKNAQAEGEKLRNKAMLGAGGDIIVALEAARNINISTATLSTLDIDFLDIEKMIEKFGVPKNKK